ncbi:MAG: molybdenum cofactor guanylyltransferase [Candidatus Solibacter usitatus]|nr:molybdenum cofactor guanylyltransferase [Candidatus Solibacter usitatus]
MRAAGFVLTGGRSSRLGRDKALLPFAGATLVEWVAGQVRQAAGSACLVGATERYGHLGLPLMEERYPGRGPLSGIEAALREGGAEWSLIAACDLPGVEAPFLKDLLEAALASEAEAVVACGAGGRLEPLCAVYHASLHGAVEQALVESRLAVHKLLEDWDIVRFPVAAGRLVSNINTAEEWTAWGQ